MHGFIIKTELSKWRPQLLICKMQLLLGKLGQTPTILCTLKCEIFVGSHMPKKSACVTFDIHAIRIHHHCPDHYTKLHKLFCCIIFFPNKITEITIIFIASLYWEPGSQKQQIIWQWIFLFAMELSGFLIIQFNDGNNIQLW